MMKMIIVFVAEPYLDDDRPHTHTHTHTYIYIYIHTYIYIYVEGVIDHHQV